MFVLNPLISHAVYFDIKEGRLWSVELSNQRLDRVCTLIGAPKVTIMWVDEQKGLWVREWWTLDGTITKSTNQINEENNGNVNRYLEGVLPSGTEKLFLIGIWKEILQYYLSIWYMHIQKHTMCIYAYTVMNYVQEKVRIHVCISYI